MLKFQPGLTVMNATGPAFIFSTKAGDFMSAIESAFGKA
jgi:hypothetical protein